MDALKRADAAPVPVPRVASPAAMVNQISRFEERAGPEIAARADQGDEAAAAVRRQLAEARAHAQRQAEARERVRREKATPTAQREPREAQARTRQVAEERERVRREEAAREIGDDYDHEM